MAARAGINRSVLEVCRPRAGELPPGSASRLPAQRGCAVAACQRARRRLSLCQLRSTSDRVLRCRRADDVTAEVDVERHRRVGVAELVGDLAGCEAGFVEAGGDGLAEGVRGDPRPWAVVAAQPLTARAELERAVGSSWKPVRAQASQSNESSSCRRSPDTLVGSRNTSGQRSGEGQAVTVAGRPAAHHRDSEVGYGDNPPAGGSLRARLHDESLPGYADDGGVDLPRAGVEVKQRTPSPFGP